MRPIAFVVAATAMMTTQPIVTRLSQNGSGGYDYIVMTAVLCAEMLKFVVSFVYYVACVPPQRRTHDALRAREIAAFGVPAAIYALNNALVFVIVSEIRPTTFQILSAFKTVFTLILFRLVLKRVPTNNQYVAVLLLAAGAAVSRLNTVEYCGDAASGEGDGSDDGALGAFLTLVSCLASSLGGIANEALLKKDAGLHALSLQNLLLYAFGVAVNAIALVIRDGRDLASYGFFSNYTWSTLLVVATNALTGLCISAVLKYGSNILRVFAHTGAMLLSMVFEVVLFGLAASPELILAACIVAGSAAIYNNDPAPRPRESGPRAHAAVQLREARSDA